MNTFGKRETIGGHAQAVLDDLRRRFNEGIEDKETLITEIDEQLGDSVEKYYSSRLFLIATIQRMTRFSTDAVFIYLCATQNGKDAGIH